MKESFNLYGINFLQHSINFTENWSYYNLQIEINQKLLKDSKCAAFPITYIYKYYIILNNLLTLLEFLIGYWYRLDY